MTSPEPLTCGTCPACGSQLHDSREATEAGIAVPGASAALHVVTCELCTRRLFRVEVASDDTVELGPWLILGGLYV